MRREVAIAPVPLLLQLLFLAAVIAASLPERVCGERQAAPAGPEGDWLSEPEYRFGDPWEGPAAFGLIPYLRVTADGQRVFVLEPNESRVSVWTPEGRLLLDLGRSGEGPGDFAFPYRIHLDDSWFYVRDQVRFTYFSYGGRLLRTVPNPPTLVSYQGFRILADALLADGSFLGVADIPASVELGMWGDDPFHRLPVLRVESEDGWSAAPVFLQNSRNGSLGIPRDDGDGYHFAAQPYSDADLIVFDPGTGTILVARRAGEDLGPGEAEVLEVSAGGDTLWRRRLAVEPSRLSQAALEARIAGLEELLSVGFSREAIEKALYAPEYLPTFSDWPLSPTRHVWLRTHEQVDTLTVWYSIERGDDRSPPRRVLLPEWFQVMDATETHVWGVWKDELDVNYVVGRRLVAAGR